MSRCFFHDALSLFVLLEAILEAQKGLIVIALFLRLATARKKCECPPPLQN